MRKVGPRPGEEVVQADDIVAFLDQAFTQVGTEEPRPSRDQYACGLGHRDSLPAGVRFMRGAFRGQTKFSYFYHGCACAQS